MSTLPGWQSPGAWDRWHTKREVPHPMGFKPTYAKAVAFLDLPGRLLEDWGGGTAYASHYVKHARYRLVDGSRSRFVDQIADLATYRSSAECVLMRHVLEHNPNTWQAILDNMLASFRERGVFICFEPFGPVTKLIRVRFPSLQFRREDLTERIPDDVAWYTEEFKTETLFYLSR